MISKLNLGEPVNEALVVFRHGHGCQTGFPYGTCTEDCDYKVVAIKDERMTEWERFYILLDYKVTE